jgi:hypothetical protein
LLEVTDRLAASSPSDRLAKRPLDSGCSTILDVRKNEDRVNSQLTRPQGPPR